MNCFVHCGTGKDRPMHLLFIYETALGVANNKLY